ncbi:3D domain-containing protein [Salinisphaera sp. RV14]|uniref:3D domain-containing protein n=1 Tax=unclassified Salinisphaera TaxID=2649847 RepID=UPI003F8697A8
MRRKVCAVACAGLLLLTSCGAASAESVEWKTLSVAASAYNSVPAQTTRHDPSVAAWGDVLKPGMHAIAVSRDLIKKGLTHGTKVKIQGLPGVYVVRDKMAARWTNKIDIYMGHDVAKARDWGIQHDIHILYADNGNS